MFEIPDWVVAVDIPLWAELPLFFRWAAPSPLAVDSLPRPFLVLLLPRLVVSPRWFSRSSFRRRLGFSDCLEASSLAAGDAAPSRIAFAPLDAVAYAAPAAAAVSPEIGAVAPPEVVFASLDIDAAALSKAASASVKAGAAAPLEAASASVGAGAAAPPEVASAALEVDDAASPKPVSVPPQAAPPFRSVGVVSVLSCG